MTTEEIRLLLDAVRSGAVPVERAAEQLDAGRLDTHGGYVDLETAKVDTDRMRRRGFPEVIYCESKRPEDVVPIVRTLVETGGLAYGTRCGATLADAILGAFPEGEYDPVSRTIRVGAPREPVGDVVTAVIAAGTSDRPVAEEACRTLETFGAPVDRIYDVGVAGIHRLLGQRERIDRAEVLIVVAGMEGALPSVVGGLCRQPLIAVPTSVGYGTALGGFTALFGMLTSCASGITVVNVDNGFGAAMAALSIVSAIRRHRHDGAHTPSRQAQ
jgi:NCAIR mutase (PurE)-related protein